MSDIFSTNAMMGVVNNTPRLDPFLLDRYFPMMQTESSEEIHFDVIDQPRRIAPFVSPVVEGKVVQSQGYTTKTFTPAYIKDKRIFDSERPLKRMVGETIGGSYTPAYRIAALLTAEIQDQTNMVNRRLEVMAAEALRTGAVTIEGDLYPAQNVNFQRDPSLSIVLTDTSRWNQAGVNPLDHLQDWAQLILNKSGSMPDDVVMTVDVWRVFRENPFVKSRLEQLRGNSTLTQNAQAKEGAVLMGMIDGFNIYVYSGWYLDEDGNEHAILPPATALLLSKQVNGVRAFGAIRDEQANFMAIPYYPKSWVTDDPSVRYLLMQSAPLIVPTRVNACLSAVVL